MAILGHQRPLHVAPDRNQGLGYKTVLYPILLCLTPGDLNDVFSILNINIDLYGNHFVYVFFPFLIIVHFYNLGQIK